MTRDEMIEKLAKAINGPHNPVPSDSKHTLSDLRDVRWTHLSKSEKQLCVNAAAAVLDLCGPKPLRWEKEDDVAILTGRNARELYRIFPQKDGVFWCPKVQLPSEPSQTLEAAQAAAQAHADAAHWANTPLGDL